jgi:hypothetical protein
VVDTADPLLAAMTGEAQPTTSSQAAASDGTDAPTLESSTSALDVAETAPSSRATADLTQPDNMVTDALASAAPVVGTVEPVIASAGVSLSNPSADPLPPDLEDTSPVPASGPADTLLALATATDAPIEAPAFATAAQASLEADAPDAATAGDASPITGDVIALNDAPPPSENSLFSGTQYTEYGVTLTSDIVVPQQPIVAPTDTATAQDALVPVVGDVQQHAPSPTDTDTIPSIDHLGLRDAIL